MLTFSYGLPPYILLLIRVSTVRSRTALSEHCCQHWTHFKSSLNIVRSCAQNGEVCGFVVINNIHGTGPILTPGIPDMIITATHKGIRPHATGFVHLESQTWSGSRYVIRGNFEHEWPQVLANSMVMFRSVQMSCNRLKERSLQRCTQKCVL
jgi:hypothetical protein